MAGSYEFIGYTGHVLSPAEEASLGCSIPLLCSEYQRQVQFWGKVMGITNDYLIVQAYGDDLLDRPTTLYSLDGQTWNLLLPTSSDRAELCTKINGYFHGDPSYEYKVPDGESTVPLKESERLAQFIDECDYHCAVVPRGALMRTEKGKVVHNRMFEGLEPSKASKLNSYFHRRRLENEDTPLLLQEHLDANLDCMPGIHNDIPEGTWCVKYDPVLGVVHGESAAYQGAVWYHKVGTPAFGYYYFGHGQRNRDLCFLLS
eukprot:Sspe_Gene.54310::Locus_29979_Transcript_1_1_Confidence_1.000_Length_879::g.54310::m.54310/K19757/RSPH9; radial spoke head protein 9